MNSQRLGLGAALLTGLSWGGMFPIMASLLHVLDPFWFTTVRYVGASIVLLIMLLIVEGPRAFRLEGRGWVIVLMGAVSIAGFNILVLEGIRMAGAEHGGLLVAMNPMFTALLLWLRTGAKPKPITFAMMVAAFAGVALVVTKGSIASVLHGGSALGDVLIALGVFSIAMYNVGSAEFRDWSALRFTTLSVTFGTLVTVAITAAASLSGISHAPGLQLTPALTGGMLYMILVAAVFAYISWNFAIARVGPQNAVLFMNLVPIVTFAIEFILGQRFAAAEYAGAALTIAALVVNNIATRPHKAAAAKADTWEAAAS